MVFIITIIIFTKIINLFIITLHCTILKGA